MGQVQPLSIILLLCTLCILSQPIHARFHLFHKLASLAHKAEHAVLHPKQTIENVVKKSTNFVKKEATKAAEAVHIVKTPAPTSSLKSLLATEHSVIANATEIAKEQAASNHTSVTTPAPTTAPPLVTLAPTITNAITAEVTKATLSPPSTTAVPTNRTQLLSQLQKLAQYAANLTTTLEEDFSGESKISSGVTVNKDGTEISSSLIDQAEVSDFNNTRSSGKDDRVGMEEGEILGTVYEPFREMVSDIMSSGILSTSDENHQSETASLNTTSTNKSSLLYVESTVKENGEINSTFPNLHNLEEALRDKVTMAKEAYRKKKGILLMKKNYSSDFLITGHNTSRNGTDNFTSDHNNNGSHLLRTDNSTLQTLLRKFFRLPGVQSEITTSIENAELKENIFRKIEEEERELWEARGRKKASAFSVHDQIKSKDNNQEEILAATEAFSKKRKERERAEMDFGWT
eukprot:g3569.t1